MKAIKLILTLSLISFTLVINAQDVESYENDFDHRLASIPNAIYNEDKCESLINELDDINEEVEELLEGDGLDQRERAMAKALKKKVEAIENFLRTVGTSGYIKWDLKESELALVKELLPVQVVRISANKYCVDVYAISLDRYVCWVAFKQGGSDIYKITAKMSSSNGSKRYSMEMGLQGNHYRALWNNGENLNQKSVLINSINCTKTSSSSFSSTGF